MQAKVRSAARIVGACALVVTTTACTVARETPGPTTSPVFATDVAPILQAHCAECHGSDAGAPAAGWSVTSYLSTIACVAPSGAPATVTSSSMAPILAALSTAPHQGLLDDGERATLTAWVAAGAPAFAAGVHPPGIIDPRSSDFHGALLRGKRWSQMLDANDPEACGGCHQGAPASVPGITVAAAGATACTTCHAEPGGALACDTCHGANGHAYPPRDLCFFPNDQATAGAHAIHSNASPASASGLPCSTCHPTPGADVISGLHGDGTVEVVFDPARVTGEASYDAASGACAVSCHDLGGATPRAKWTDTTALTCTSCHASPPANHYPGSCTNCHSEANASGTALSGGPLHMNGKVDLGNGSGLCGACHGTGASPWPSTAAHPHHQNPSLSVGVACASCHPVPSSITDPLHLDGIVHVTFAGAALARNAQPVWNGTSCAGSACHGANLGAPPAVIPAWNDTSGAAAKCGACHGIPPSANHTVSTSCSRSDCHGAEIDIAATGVPSISMSGVALHINGVVTP